MGVLTGVLGAMTPYLTGQMIDRAIPQGEHSLLLQLGLGMVVAALATAAFRITQSIAVVRVESRMDYALQSALWDRLLDLPSAFFRKYGAGDLAERAAGINTIRGLVSRAGVGGILGAFSSVAYVVLMMTYSFKLTLIAMGITLTLIGLTTLGNYFQLRYQRLETTQRGIIASLVLQLIAGVAKVRVCAAENHAFRVWAQKFSQQKRTAFSSGQIAERGRHRQCRLQPPLLSRHLRLALLHAVHGAARRGPRIHHRHVRRLQRGLRRVRRPPCRR